MGQGLIDWCEVLSFQYSFATVPRGRKSRCFEAGLFLLSTNHAPFARLLQLMLYGQRHHCNISATVQYLYKKHWSQLTTTEEFSNQTFGFLVLLCFLNLMLICGVGIITWECTPLQEILTRKGISSKEIWRDICSPD